MSIRYKDIMRENGYALIKVDVRYSRWKRDYSGLECNVSIRENRAFTIFDAYIASPNGEKIDNWYIRTVKGIDKYCLKKIMKDIYKLSLGKTSEWRDDEQAILLTRGYYLVNNSNGVAEYHKDNVNGIYWSVFFKNDTITVKYSSGRGENLREYFFHDDTWKFEEFLDYLEGKAYGD